MTRRKRGPTPAIVAALLLAATAGLADEQWSHYGGNAGGQQFAPADQITAANVAGLEVAWTYRTGELQRRSEFANATAKFQANPILLPPAAGGHLVVCSPFNRVIALDPEYGTERWIFDPGVRIGGYATAADPEGRASPPFINCRGVTYWEDRAADPDARCRHRVFVATHDLRLVALDAPTGSPCTGFGAGGSVAVEPAVLGATPPAAIGEVKFASPPVIVNGVLVVGSVVRDFHRHDAPNGAVRAFDARSGAPRWHFDPVPRAAGDPAAADWSPAALAATGGGNVWGLMSVDEDLDLVYLPTSGPSPDFYGGTRPGDNRYADSLVALRGRTGEVAWHFQTVHHDVWDYDNAAQPTFVELEKDGRPFPAVVQATKTGMLFIFHRATGAPFFPIEERPVPRDGVPGEVLSPTQPFPVRPPPLVPHDFSAAEFWGPTFIDRWLCQRKYRGYRTGSIYTPPSLEGTIILPSSAGGVNWGGVAVDPRSRVLVTKVLRIAHFARLVPVDELAERAEAVENLMGAPAPLAGTPYALVQGPVVSPMFTPCTAPPWAALVAVDLQAGEILWQSALGTLDTLMPVPLPLRWGTASFGGPIVTGGGLAFVGATQDDRLRAFDVATGEELWSARLPTGAFALPMSYVAGGRQYVVTVAGGHPFIYPRPGDYVVAFALPRNVP